MDELRDLTSFNQNVSVYLGKVMQHMTDSMLPWENLVLLCCDAYLDHLKPWLKGVHCVMPLFNPMACSRMKPFIEEDRVLVLLRTRKGTLPSPILLLSPAHGNRIRPKPMLTNSTLFRLLQMQFLFPTL